MTNDKLREALKWADAEFALHTDDESTMPVEAWMHVPVLAECARAALAAPVEAEPVAQLRFNLPAAQALVEWFGGERDDETILVVRQFPETRDEEDGGVMPAGLYCWFEDYPEDGRLPLFDENKHAHPAEQGNDAEDAARYRWIKANVYTVNTNPRVWGINTEHNPLDGRFESAIDAARNAKPAKGG